MCISVDLVVEVSGEKASLSVSQHLCLIYLFHLHVGISIV